MSDPNNYYNQIAYLNDKPKPHPAQLEHILL